ncbi:MAG: DNA primase [Parcubacteria group bacterium]|nr:DNA primase [Parcubacteria group bacterium]
MSSSVEQIKDRLSIVDVVGAYVTLEKSGSNLRARCPFHNERTPSFFVSPERGTYHCFGCDAGGDIFEFVKSFEGVDFYGALKILAAKAGVTIERSDPKARDEKERLYHVLEEATLFFEKALAAAPQAEEYLEKRGVTDESRAAWRLGYAPDEWRGLLSFFLAKGIKEEALEKTGLVIRTREGRYYDRFRGRVMFPIADSSGRIIAFSARLLPIAKESADVSHEAKYINSPETELYRKSSALYGFDKAKQAIREEDACIIVEGQMDVLLTHQAGVKNAVATSGTALTGEHIGRIRRFTEKIVFAFDADAAGLSATERGLKLALKEGMEVRLAHLPHGMDPADLGARAPKDLAERLKNARHAVDFFLTVLEETISDPRRRKIETGKKVLPLIVRMKNRIEQAHFITETARGRRRRGLFKKYGTRDGGAPRGAIADNRRTFLSARA